MMKIHKEGKSILLLSLVALLVFLGCCFYFKCYILWIIFALLLVLYGFMVWFFRNPDRTFNGTDLEVVAPVDGKVVVIEKVFENEYFKDERLQVSIFMSPLNVHVCRYPVSGVVVYTKYHPGKYLVAFHPKSSELNERTTVVVKTANGQEVLFRQIAGAVARRIVLYAKKGDRAVAGEEYGFIKFGSRLDVFLPLDADIQTELKHITKGAVDVISHLKN